VKITQDILYENSDLGKVSARAILDLDYFNIYTELLFNWFILYYFYGISSKSEI
jgi:hypothetical protein